MALRTTSAPSRSALADRSDHPVMLITRLSKADKKSQRGRSPSICRTQALSNGAIPWYLYVSPSWCRHFLYLGTDAPATNFARKRIKIRYLTLFRATKNCVVICRASFTPQPRNTGVYYYPRSTMALVHAPGVRIPLTYRWIPQTNTPGNRGIHAEVYLKRSRLGTSRWRRLLGCKLYGTHHTNQRKDRDHSPHLGRRKTRTRTGRDY